MTFEDALKRLGEISELMENPEITLKKATDLYAEAKTLAEQCEKNIKDAKLTLEEMKE